MFKYVYLHEGNGYVIVRVYIKYYISLKKNTSKHPLKEVNKHLCLQISKSRAISKKNIQDFRFDSP